MTLLMLTASPYETQKAIVESYLMTTTANLFADSISTQLKIHRDIHGERIALDDLNEICNYSDQLKATLKEYD